MDEVVPSPYIPFSKNMSSTSLPSRHDPIPWTIFSHDRKLLFLKSYCWHQCSEFLQIFYGISLHVLGKYTIKLFALSGYVCKVHHCSVKIMWCRGCSEGIGHNPMFETSTFCLQMTWQNVVQLGTASFNDAQLKSFASTSSLHKTEKKSQEWCVWHSCNRCLKWNKDTINFSTVA